MMTGAGDGGAQRWSSVGRGLGVFGWLRWWRKSMLRIRPALIRWGFLEILDDERDASIRWIEGVRFFSEALIGETPNLGNLVQPNAAGLHEAASGVGTIGGKLPIGVGGAFGVGLGISVAFDGNFVG